MDEWMPARLRALRREVAIYWRRPSPSPRVSRREREGEGVPENQTKENNQILKSRPPARTALRQGRAAGRAARPVTYTGNLKTQVLGPGT